MVVGWPVTLAFSEEKFHETIIFRRIFASKNGRPLMGHRQVYLGEDRDSGDEVGWEAFF